MIRQYITGFILLFTCYNASADAIRPGYLEIKEQTTNTYSVLWKVPKKGSRDVILNPQFDNTCSNTAIHSQQINAAVLKHWYLNCKHSLIGTRISIKDIDQSNTEVLLRLTSLDGNIATALLKPSNPYYDIPQKNSDINIAVTYFGLGTEHILLGSDHLLFVFALLLIVNNSRRLIMTITAFTLAHSITLAAATLGFVHVPQQPVEAVIALSILFLAVEIIHGQQGHSGYTERWPWLVAFTFGLLHGFGFAGALAEVGLPDHAIPIALVFFNVGVEFGQLLFVLGVVLLIRLVHRLKRPQLVKHAETVVVYSIGGISSFWLFERISTF